MRGTVEGPLFVSSYILTNAGSLNDYDCSNHLLSIDRCWRSVTFDRVILITGVPAREDGEPMWASLDEACRSPSWLLAAIDTIAHVQQWVAMVNSFPSPAPIETLTLRFRSPLRMP